MTQNTFTKPERRSLWLWLLAGVAGLGCFIGLYSRAFPEAALELRLDRHAALAQSESHLKRQDADLHGFRNVVALHTIYDSKDFLEKNLPLPEANALMRDQVHTWHWHCRWYKPGQEEEYSVLIAPDGRLLGYSHLLPEDAPGASLSSADAQALAENFLEGLSHLAEIPLRLVESTQIDRPERLDHRFEWEREDSRPAGATYRVYVTVAGDSIAAYGEYLKIPEDAIRARNEAHSERYFLQRLFNYAHRGVQLAAVVVLLLALRAGTLRVRYALCLGAVMACLAVLQQLNYIPQSWMYYDTAETTGAYFAKHVVDALGEVVGTVMEILFVALPAVALSRRVFPDKADPAAWTTRRFWNSKETLVAAFVGCCMAGLWLAYVTLFYIVGGELGVWVPTRVPYMNTLATPMPWLYPLTTGLFPAVTEELTFRLFAIAALLSITKRRWLAIAVPALIWGFLHSGYPQEPIYIRGLELTISGIFTGWVFLRYGIVATIVTHYAYNATLSSMPMIRSGDPYLQLSRNRHCCPGSAPRPGRPLDTATRSPAVYHRGNQHRVPQHRPHAPRYPSSPTAPPRSALPSSSR